MRRAARGGRPARMSWEESLRAQLASLRVLPRALRPNRRAVHEVIRAASRTRGFLYLTGVGKNGFVAAKVSSTFNSLGIKSMFVDPVNTLHGDMGIFGPDDLLFFVTKSGETPELITLSLALTNIGFDRTVCVTSSKDSTLWRRSRFHLLVPVPSEGDHLELAPVASSLAYTLVLQALGVHISSSRGFSRRDFVRLHPGGALGRTKVD